jgi:hypothetical protein
VTTGVCRGRQVYHKPLLVELVDEGMPTKPLKSSLTSGNSILSAFAVSPELSTRRGVCLWFLLKSSLTSGNSILSAFGVSPAVSTAAVLSCIGTPCDGGPAYIVSAEEYQGGPCGGNEGVPG